MSKKGGLAGWVIFFLIFIFAVIFIMSSDSDEVSKTPTKPYTGGKNIELTSQIVKKVDDKCRYFFDIRNKDTKPFSGSVKITLRKEDGTHVWDDTFSTNQPIQPELGTSVYTDAFTCPPSIHSVNGIAKFTYEVKASNQVLKTGYGRISDKFEYT